MGDWLRHTLPAPILSVLWLYLMGEATVSKVPFPGAVALFLVVTAIYGSDRLLERDHEQLKERHRWIQSHPVLAWLGLAWIGILIAYLLVHMHVFPLPFSVIMAGSGSVLYLILSFAWRTHPGIKEWVKNVLCAMVFACGCWAPIAIAQSTNSSHKAPPFLILTQLTMVVLMNLRLTHELEIRPGKFFAQSFGLLAILLFISCIATSPLTWVFGISGAVMLGVAVIFNRHIHAPALDLVLIVIAAFALAI